MDTILTGQMVMDSLGTSLETALLGSTALPSTLCGRADMASSTSFAELYVTNPNPLDLFVSESLMTYGTVWAVVISTMFEANVTKKTHKPLTATMDASNMLLTTQSVRVPHCSKWARRLSSVVSKLSPPINSLRSCSGSRGACECRNVAITNINYMRTFAFMHFHSNTFMLWLVCFEVIQQQAISVTPFLYYEEISNSS